MVLRAVQGLGASEPLPPSGFRWPSDAEYATELIRSVDQMMPEVGRSATSSAISPPLQTQLAGLRGTLETVTNLPFGQLSTLASDVNALANATTPAEIVSEIGSLLDTGVNIATDTMEALGVASEIVEVVPIVGQIAGLVLGFIGMLLGLPSRAEQVEECKKALAQEVNPMCDRLWRESTEVRPSGYDRKTSTVIVSPADQFRPLAYRFWQGSRQYPDNMTTLLVMMCGGAAGDFGMSEERYRQIVGWMHKGRVTVGNVSTAIPKNTKAGLPRDVRDKLWQLIRTTMSCVQDPQDVYAKNVGDQGRTPTPIMLDIVRIARERGYLDDVFMTFLANEGLDWTSRKRVWVPGGKKGIPPEIACYDSCKVQYQKTKRPDGSYVVRVPPMVAQLNERVSAFHRMLVEEFDPERTGKLRATPGSPIIGEVITIPNVGAVKKLPFGKKLSYTPTLRFSGPVVNDMQSLLDKIENPRPGNAAIAAFTLGLGAAAFFAGRYAAGRGR